ncbi:hypothetical protein Tco_0977961 [Tanacetum coccineum]|uniref:Glycine-rich protein n=1 Tax=Tanacetum coccineum TaxID=301880 RepID=A0ABQ5ELP8_9ASTR
MAKKIWLVIFVALVLVLGTTEAGVDLGRKVGFGTTKNPTNGDEEDANGDAGVDSHHSYNSGIRPGPNN